MNEYLTLEGQSGLLQVSLKNDWIFNNLNILQETLDGIEPQPGQRVRFSCGGLKDFDLAGAWILYERSMDFEEVGIETEFEGFRATHFKFLQHIIDIAAQKEYIPSRGITGATAYGKLAKTPSRRSTRSGISHGRCWMESSALPGWLSAKPSARFMPLARRPSPS